MADPMIRRGTASRLGLRLPPRLDPNWRDRYVEVEINGIRQHVDPADVAFAAEFHLIMRDAHKALEAIEFPRPDRESP